MKTHEKRAEARRERSLVNAGPSIDVSVALGVTVTDAERYLDSSLKNISRALSFLVSSPVSSSIGS
jgi:hypothetical protein